MRNFFKWTIKLGLRIIIIALIIWVIFFSLKYFFPETYNLAQQKVLNEANSGGSNLPFRYKVYNFLFNNSKYVNFHGKENVKKIKDFYSQGSEVWGSNSSSTIRNQNKLNPEDNYIFINSPDQDIANNFRFDDEVIDPDNSNDLNETTIITGDLSLNYQSSPYFTVDLYDKEGNYLYSLFGKGIVDSNREYMNIEIQQNNNWNYSHYSGEGFLVIWSNNREVDGVLISKINILEATNTEAEILN